jgi:hypothetical protein
MMLATRWPGKPSCLIPSNSYIYAGSRTVASIGLDNIAIIETDDAVLVAEKSRLQTVKQLVERLQEKGSVLGKQRDADASPLGQLSIPSPGGLVFR